MKILKFNESLSDNLSLVKEYSTTISDEYEMEIITLSENLYKVIVPHKKINNSETLSEFSDKFLKCQELITRIDPEEFSLKMNEQDLSLEIILEFNSGSESFSNLLNGTLTIVKSRMKNIIESKFGIKMIEIDVNFDNINHEILLTFEFDSPISDGDDKILDKMEDLIKFIQSDKYIGDIVDFGMYSIEFEIKDQSIGEVKIV